MPVFSVEYKLAMTEPYPAALDDCWQAYNWLIYHHKDYIGKFI